MKSWWHFPRDLLCSDEVTHVWDGETSFLLREQRSISELYPTVIAGLEVPLSVFFHGPHCVSLWVQGTRTCLPPPGPSLSSMFTDRAGTDTSLCVDTSSLAYIQPRVSFNFGEWSFPDEVIVQWRRPVRGILNCRKAFGREGNFHSPPSTILPKSRVREILLPSPYTCSILPKQVLLT